MSEITATDAARHFSDLLDAIEHRGESFTIMRRGKAIALLEPTKSEGGAAAKSLLRRHKRDPNWRSEIEALRDLLELDTRE